MSNNFGFYISGLKLTGLHVKPANIEFTKGFNVISGLSDTGKSYIFSCLDFMLGGGDAPKEVPEATGYSDVFIELQTYSGKIFTLNRKINGGRFTVKEVKIDNFQTSGIAKELKEQHSSTSSDNISQFLLELSGFSEKFVRKDKTNKKRNLSFRDIAGLTLIDEERIITTKSPVYISGQYANQTQEQSVLEILLTGKDAKELEEVEEAKVYQSRIKGKIEFVASLVKELSTKLEAIEKENPIEKQNQLQTKIDQLSIALQKSSLNLESLTVEKQHIFNKISELESKNILNEELKSRFLLLQEHYDSDIKRLEFITEGEGMFSQLTTIKCPICGSDMNKDHYDHIIEDREKGSNIIESVEKEAVKIKFKLLDLDSTLKQLATDINERDKALVILRKDYASVMDEIQNNIEPIKSSTKQEIDALIKELSLIKEQDLIKEQISNYYSQKAILEKELAKKPKIGALPDGLKYTVLQGLCDTIKDILTRWKYPNILTVNFNTEYKIYDFVINNKVRYAHGKGIRAITYSAFTVGLMNYCIKNNLPHSKVIIIDSPLTTYHGKEQGEINEEISRDMQDSFFKDLSETHNDRQIIVIDNKDPDEELKSKINYIHFTNDRTKGRQGFFPS